MNYYNYMYSTTGMRKCSRSFNPLPAQMHVLYAATLTPHLTRVAKHYGITQTPPVTKVEKYFCDTMQISVCRGGHGGEKWI
jgi:hypothetical protein